MGLFEADIGSEHRNVNQYVVFVNGEHIHGEHIHGEHIHGEHIHGELTPDGEDPDITF